MERQSFNEGSTPEKKAFDRESRDSVRESLVAVMEEVVTIVDSSNLKQGTKNEIRNFLNVLLIDFEDDGVVERGWVSFTSGGDIIRARSEDGVYDAKNTLRYIQDELQGKFFNPLAVSFLNESQKEMHEVKVAVQALFSGA